MQLGNLQMLIDIFNENKERDFFNCVAITAKVRKGKSRLAHLIAKGVYPNFSYEQNYLGNPKHYETATRLFDTPEKSCSWIDEAEKILSSERRMDKEQWWLQQLFNQFASHNKTILLCTPSFRRIDSRWRDAHISFWIYIYRRGCAIVLKNRDIQSSSDIWGLEAMKEQESSTRADNFSDERILQNFEKNPCALFYFTFPDWASKEEKEEYMKWKGKSQQDFRNELTKAQKSDELLKKTNRAELGLGRIAAYFDYKYQIPCGEIGKISGYSDEAIRGYKDNFYEGVGEGAIDESYLPKKYFSPEFLMDIKAKYAEKAKL